MTDKEMFETVRARAYEIADTGRPSGWNELSAELIAERQPERLVRRLGSDALTKLMLQKRIDAARERG